MNAALIDRLLRRLPLPVPIAAYTPAPVEFGPDIWTIERSLRMPGALILPTCSTVVRVANGKLVVISPPAVDSDLAISIRHLGEPVAAIAPNSFHYVFLASFGAAFPEVTTFIPPRMKERLGASSGMTLTAAPQPLWADHLDQCIFGPIGNFVEVPFFHKSSATLILTDLGFNLVHLNSILGRIGWRSLGVSARFGPSRSTRLTLLNDAARARDYLRPILHWPFERIIVAHGTPVVRDARREFSRAYAAYL